jgi:two-component system sensor histidine kinase KdpD
MPELWTPRARSMIGYLLAVGGTALLVVAMLPSRADLTTLSHGFAFLVLVVLTVAVGGLGPGIVASVLGFLAFNFFFIPPFGTFSIARPEHVVILFVFLGLSIFISVLVARARSRAEAAEQREHALQVQQELSRALVEPRPGIESYEHVLSMLVRQFGFSEATLFVQPLGDLSGLEEAVHVRSEVAGPDVRELERLALSVGLRNLGLLVLKGDRPPLNDYERGIVDAFRNQLALVLERDRVLRAAVAAERERTVVPGTD